MIVTKVGNLLDVEVGIIVHGCNSLGVMGSGFALEVKQRHPDVFNKYVAYCASAGGRSIGTVQLCAVSEYKYIINAITQKKYGSGLQVSYEAIRSCFEAVNEIAKQLTIDNIDYKLPIMFPLIGAGRGGGDWNIISKIIDESISDEFDKQLWVLQ